MITVATVTLNPALDRFYWVEKLQRDPETPLTRARRSRALPGGKGINVALFLARLGVEALALGFAAGATGQTVLGKLREAGVFTDFIWLPAGETRTDVIILEGEQRAAPVWVDAPGPEVPEVAWERFLKRYQRALQRVSYVVISGSLPPGLPETAYAELTELANAQGVRAVLNAAGEPLERALEARPFLAKPDLRERPIFLGADVRDAAAREEAGERALAAGAEAVLISHEITGDLLLTPTEAWDFVAEGLTIRNIVGAQDALVGGIVYRLLAGEGLAEATRFGMAAASAVAAGTAIADLDLERINDYLPRIRVEQLKLER